MHGTVAVPFVGAMRGKDWTHIFILLEFKEILNNLQKIPNLPISKIAKQSNETWEKPSGDSDETFRYLEISNVSLGTNEYVLEDVPVCDAPSRTRMLLRSGDIVISTTRPHRGAIAEIRAEDDQTIGSTGFVILREHLQPEIRRDYFLYTLLSDIVLIQFLQRSSGGSYPAIVPDEIDRVIIPATGYPEGTG